MSVKPFNVNVDVFGSMPDDCIAVMSSTTVKIYRIVHSKRIEELEKRLDKDKG